MNRRAVADVFPGTPTTEDKMRPSMRRSVRLFAVAAALVLVLAACGGDDDDDDAGGTSDEPTTTTAPADEQADATTTTAPADAGGGASDQAATVAYAETSLGDALVDESGLTLYVFDNDTPGTSTCTEGCAEAWPPVIVPGDIVVGDGLDEGLFTTIDRGNGEMQLAVAGHPLYRFSGDAAAGDVNGEGVGNVWFVAAPDGSAVQAAAAEDASQGAGGY
jgi:predicted lipoprotein with Yx(FWY)xxD motif